MARELRTASADGTDVRAHDEGHGPVILVLHAARDDGSSWARVAARLSHRFRVVRLHRRQHRVDLEAFLPCSIATEVEDVLAVAQLTGTPVVLVGHSAGAVVALEALAEHGAMFSGALLYEPPLRLGPPVGGEALERARTTLAAGKPGRALAIFLRDVVRVRPALARLVGAITAISPGRRALVSHQLDDCAAVDQLGVRLDVYAGIDGPTVLLGGDRSPAHFGERMDALARVMPNAERVVLPGQGHHAHILAPDKVAGVIVSLADRARPG